jgi:hypothetical protein
MVQPTRPWPPPPPTYRPNIPGPWDLILATNWKKVFAFLPVETVRGDKVWLKFVYKRTFRSITGLSQVEYGDIFDVMKAEYD